MSERKRAARWIHDLLALADKLPTGRRDPRALAKLAREREELAEALAKGDRLGAVLEAGDVAYYAAKCVANGLLSREEAEAEVTQAAGAVGLTFKEVIKAAKAKFGLRARPGNPKNDAEERAAVAKVLDINHNS